MSYSESFAWLFLAQGDGQAGLRDADVRSGFLYRVECLPPGLGQHVDFDCIGYEWVHSSSVSCCSVSFLMKDAQPSHSDGSHQNWSYHAHCSFI